MRPITALALVIAACAATPTTQTAVPVGPSRGAAPRSSSGAVASGARASSPAAPSTAAAPAPRNRSASVAASPSAADRAACPSGMKLVDGDYCTEVDQKCLKSWFDESNKKLVCEEFEPPTRCIGDKVKKRFCIDEYSWPNVKGERPEVMNNFYQAQVKCAAVGKRMCTESEWTLACEGPEMKPFPYGYKRDPAKCNGDQPWDGPNMVKVAQRDPEELARLWQGVRNGAQPECVSDFGIADLPGNTDDVVASETFTNDWRGKYSSVHSGGPWYKGVRNQCRPKIYTHDEGFYYYFLGFRCCSNPDAEHQPNDPRTPKQIKQNMSFQTVERLARFTVSEMRDKLEKKAHGACTCKPKDILCKTMCGTLLGPSAQDVTLGVPRATSTESGKAQTAPPQK